MKIWNIVRDEKFGFDNLSFMQKPTSEMREAMKKAGWRYSSSFARWYPGTDVAKKNVSKFLEKFEKIFGGNEISNPADISRINSNVVIAKEQSSNKLTYNNINKINPKEILEINQDSLAANPPEDFAEIEKEKLSVQKQIQQLKDELNNPDVNNPSDDQYIPETKEYIERLENMTDEDFKNLAAWKKRNQKENEETHRSVVEQTAKERKHREIPQEGEILSYNETHPTYSVVNKESGRQALIQPSGRLAENVRKLARLGSLAEANDVIAEIKSSGFEILSTKSRILIFNEDKFYDFDSVDSYFNYEINRFEHNSDKRTLNEWDFKDYVSGGLKITKRMKEFEKIESAVTQLSENGETENKDYIHSEEFVSKFGDWEKANRIEKLKNAKSLVGNEKITVLGNDITDLVERLRGEYSVSNLKQLQNIAKDIGKGKFIDIIQQKDKPETVNLVNTKDSFEPLKPEILSPLITQREFGFSESKSPTAYYDKRLINICQVPQMPYLEMVNGRWKPKKEAVQAVKEGKLFVEKSGQNYTMHDENQKPIYFNDLTPEQKQEVIDGYRMADDQDMLTEWENVLREKLVQIKKDNPFISSFDIEKEISLAANPPEDEWISEYLQKNKVNFNTDFWQDIFAEMEAKPELKTYHTLKESDVKDLEIVSDEEFSDIVDSIILNDYKNIPNAIRLPNLNAELAKKLGLEKDSAFILKKSAAHIRPDRKGTYEQALDTEEYRKIPQVMRDSTFALVDKRFDNFQILFDDVDDIKKINKLAFNKDDLGNYLVTVGKIDRRDGISEIDNIVVGVGVAPTISALRYPEEPPATRLRPSPTTNNVVAVGVAPTIQTLRTRASSTALRASSTTDDLNIAQDVEKSSFRTFYEEINKKPYASLGRYMPTDDDLKDYERRQDIKSWDNSKLSEMADYAKRQISIGDDFWQPSYMLYLIQNESAKRTVEKSSDPVENQKQDHPEKILGKTVEYTDRFGKPATKVVPHDGLSVQDELDKIDGFLPQSIEKPGENHSRKMAEPRTEILSSNLKGFRNIADRISAIDESAQNMIGAVKIKTDAQSAEEYFSFMKSHIDFAGLLSTSVFNELENRNRHTATAALSIMGFFGKENQEYFAQRSEKNRENPDSYDFPPETVAKEINLARGQKTPEKQKIENVGQSESSPQTLAVNFVLEKLKAAGIEVVTDKEEFERILEREKFLQKMAGTLTSEEQKRYFTFNEADTARFKSQVDEWNSDKSNVAKLITVGKIPPVMKVLGFPDNPIEIQHSTLSKVMRPVPQGYPNEAQGHALSVDDIYSIPKQLADPVMVFKSRTRNDSYVFFTERKDSQNRSILIPMAVNKRKGRIVINEITSMYGRNNEIDFVKTNIDEGNLIYADKKRSTEWERSSHVQFVTQRLSNSNAYDLNILTKERLVNFISANSQKRTPVQKMSLASDKKQVEDLFVSKNEANLNSEIDKLTEKDVALKDDFITISEKTPFIFKEFGLDDFPVNMYKQKLARAFFLEEQKFGERLTHGHKGEFTSATVKDVFKDLGNPRYIFNSKLNLSSPENFYLIGVYDELDEQKNPMMLSLHFNKNRKEVEANWITSIYGKRKDVLVNNWTQKGYLVYMNDLEMEKAPAEMVTLQMRVSKSASAYIHNVKKKSDFVNDMGLLFSRQKKNVYGFAYEGKIYLNPDFLSSNVAVHEYTHLWDEYTRRTNPELWQKGMDIFKDTKFFNEVKNDPNYADIANDDNLVLSEVHARICGDMAEKILERIAKENGEITKDKAIDWNEEVFDYVYDEFGWGRNSAFAKEKMSGYPWSVYAEFLATPLKDLVSGRNISLSQNKGQKRTEKIKVSKPAEKRKETEQKNVAAAKSESAKKTEKTEQIEMTALHHLDRTNCRNFTSHMLTKKALYSYKGLPPFIVDNKGQIRIRIHGKDLSDAKSFGYTGKTIYPDDTVDVKVSIGDLRGFVGRYVFERKMEEMEKSLENPFYKKRTVVLPRLQMTESLAKFAGDYNVSLNDLTNFKSVYKEVFEGGENPILPQKKAAAKSNPVRKVAPKNLLETENSFGLEIS